MQKHFLARHLNKLIIGLISLLVVTIVFTPLFDKRGEEVVDSSFKQAMVVFATAKALNGVISLAQGTEVGPPGITVAIGEVLDPINDLVEQFSWVMLASLTSLGVQKILMNIVTNPFFDITLLILLVILNIWLYYRFNRDDRTRDLFFKFTVILIFLRISIPLMAIANEFTYTHFVAPEYNIVESGDKIALISGDVHEINNATFPDSEIPADNVDQDDPSFLDRLGRIYKENTQIFESEFYQKKIDEYQQAASDASDQIIHLIIAFVFQTIIFPLVFLFLLYQLIRKIFGFTL